MHSWWWRAGFLRTATLTFAIVRSVSCAIHAPSSSVRLRKDIDHPFIMTQVNTFETKKSVHSSEGIQGPKRQPSGHGGAFTSPKTRHFWGLYPHWTHYGWWVAWYLGSQMFMSLGRFFYFTRGVFKCHNVTFKVWTNTHITHYIDICDICVNRRSQFSSTCLIGHGFECCKCSLDPPKWICLWECRKASHGWGER